MGFVKPITGRGVTDTVGMQLADLGIPRWDAQRGCNAVCFGDNFSFGWGQEWQSPSFVCYDDDYQVLGIPTASGIASEGHRRQALDYRHGQNAISTLLPTDFIRVNNVWYLAVMVVGMRGLGDEMQTEFWQSHNLVDWERTDPFVKLEHPGGHPGDVMLTFDQIGDWIYTFGTGGLSRDKPIWLWRSKAEDFPNGWFEPWGYDGHGQEGTWRWGIPNENTPILQGRFGELCFRYIQGNCVLSFFDAGEYRQTALTIPTPNGDWTQANHCTYATGDGFPQLYGGYITPASRLNEPNGMEFLVSQWNTQGNDPYHVCLFTDTLQAQGPLVVAPVPEPVSPPEPVPEPLPKDEGEEGAMTPQELYETLLRELSASGAVEITTPEGDTLTMREAVLQIFEKERGWHRMEGRPRHPKDSDDQLGHVLNSRAEQLFTQACVVAVADHLGIDTRTLYQQVKASLG